MTVTFFAVVDDLVAAKRRRGLLVLVPFGGAIMEVEADGDWSLSTTGS